MVEYMHEKIECRYALSMLPLTANGNVMDRKVDKANGNTLEILYRYKLNGLSGKVCALAFYNTGFFGSYTAKNTIQFISLQLTGSNSVIYNIANSRQYGRSKYGFGINAEQSIGKHMGTFAKASYNDGRNETWCFTEIDQAISAGVVSDGTNWQRKNDKVGLGWCSSGLSKVHRQYLANGGLGFMLGDGKMRYRAEQVLEAYYALSLPGNFITSSFFYQLVVNPGCNADRGPIHVYSIRLHVHI
jgi:high affinity Mn2+ porin